MTSSIRSLKYLLVAAFSMMLAGPCLASVDINKADAAVIAKELKGVGPAEAKAIVEYRAKNGNFKSVDELLKVTGIGEKLLLQNRTNIVIGSAEPARQ